MEQSQPQKKTNTKYIALLLAFVSIFPLIFGGYPFFKQVALDTMGVETTGQVSELLGSETRSPVVHFTTADGQEIEFKSYYATNFLTFSAGQDVEIRYLPVYPQIAEVTLLGRLHYLSNLGATCLGVILLLAGLVALMNKPMVLDLSKRNKT